ncbi:group II intron maturase-specific domain-containing protein [Pseudalkalibacillus sp. A8]|uniref:group II intron maturase-specific domain-containing protein n=1 Tax=Pseudalkalibacillus sp. A8 TaxID=3382641 RepID=UPI0038B6072C
MRQSYSNSAEVTLVFTVSTRKVAIAKDKGRELTTRSKGWSIAHRLYRLNQYLTGWCGYFALMDTQSVFHELDKWIRRRLRMGVWKDWKLSKTRKRKLVGFGVPRGKVYEWAYSRKSYWRISGSPILKKTLDNSYWNRLGLCSLYQRYQYLHQS